MSLRVFLEAFQWSGKAHSPLQYHSMGGLLTEEKGESELNTSIYFFLFPEFIVNLTQNYATFLPPDDSLSSVGHSRPLLS